MGSSVLDPYLFAAKVGMALIGERGGGGDGEF